MLVTRSSGRPFFYSKLLVSAATVLLHQSRSVWSWNTNKMTFVTERDNAGTIIVAPRDESKQNGLIVTCHGLGDSAEGFVDVAEQMAERMPYLKFIMPTAPTQPVTMNMGMPMNSWYDIVGLDERSSENCKGLPESRARIESILQTEHETTGLPYNRMMLAGFSQGGALSLFTGLQLDQALAGIVVMSGYLPAASQLKVKHVSLPIFHGHGTSDPLVQISMAEKTKSLLTQMGVQNYTLKRYPIQHTLSMDELADVMKFVAKVLPPDETCGVKVKDPTEMSVKELKAAIKKAGLGSKAVGLMEKQEFVKLLQNHRAGK